MDNGKTFKYKDVKRICDKYDIKQSFSTPYYPQGNGQAEATNKTIQNILAKIVNDSHKDWHIQIPKALWAYHTSVCTPIGVTSFSLVYGVEASLPIELEIPSLRINLSEQISYEKIRQTRLDQLLLLDEKYINALEHMRVYQERIK